MLRHISYVHFVTNNSSKCTSMQRLCSLDVMDRSHTLLYQIGSQCAAKGGQNGHCGPRPGKILRLQDRQEKMPKRKISARACQLSGLTRNTAHKNLSAVGSA